MKSELKCVYVSTVSRSHLRKVFLNRTFLFKYSLQAALWSALDLIRSVVFSSSSKMKFSFQLKSGPSDRHCVSLSGPDSLPYWPYQISPVTCKNNKDYAQLHRSTLPLPCHPQHSIAIMSLLSISSRVEREVIFHPMKLGFHKCSLSTLRWKKRQKKEDLSKLLIFLKKQTPSPQGSTCRQLRDSPGVWNSSRVRISTFTTRQCAMRVWLQEIHAHMLIHLRPPAGLSWASLFSLLSQPLPSTFPHFPFFRWSVQAKKEKVSQTCGQPSPRKNIISRAWICSGYQQQIHANNSWLLSKLENFFNSYVIEWFQLRITSIIACYIIATASINVVWVIMQHFINRQ